MWAVKGGVHGVRARARQRGVVVVEFAVVALMLFLAFFGTIELARALYICNTLQEVTRRAAALASNSDFTSAGAMQRVREQAVLRDSAGDLPFAEPVSDQSIKIDYLSIQRNGGTLAMTAIPAGLLPDSPAANFANCLRDLYASNCIRLVRARVCAPEGGEACTRLPYRSLFSLIALDFALPESTAIVNAESLGMSDGLPVER